MNKDLLQINATRMRKNMTSEERHLWYDFLKKLPVSVYRQKVLGNYIVDFYIPKYKIAIELDGIQHQMEAHVEYDEKRTQYLNSYGVKVLRYSNRYINGDFIAVCQDILKNLDLTFEDIGQLNWKV